MDEPTTIGSDGVSDLDPADFLRKRPLNIEYHESMLTWPEGLIESFEADTDTTVPQSQDYLIVLFKMALGTDVEVMLAYEDVRLMVMYLGQWMNQMHEAGKCGCHG